MGKIFIKNKYLIIVALIISYMSSFSYCNERETEKEGLFQNLFNKVTNFVKYHYNYNKCNIKKYITKEKIAKLNLINSQIDNNEYEKKIKIKGQSNKKEIAYLKDHYSYINSILWNEGIELYKTILNE